MTADPRIEELRARISELDRTVLDALNNRLELVSELKSIKDELGIDFVDPDREQRMLEDLRAANGGPLSDEGVTRLLASLLALTRAEL